MAAASVLLTNLIGLSRVSFAMARNGQLPKAVARLHSRFRTPYVSIVIMGGLMAVLALFLDLKRTAAITSCSVLSTHIVLNYSAIRLRKKVPDMRTFKAPLYPLIPSLGLVSCIILIFFLPVESWIVAAVVATASLLCYLVRRKLDRASCRNYRQHH